jgi:uncharacterized protein YneF (UPF0154 family)
VTGFLIALIIGIMVGFVIGCFLTIRHLPRMIAKMTPAEVDALADRVAELRGD